MCVPNAKYKYSWFLNTSTNTYQNTTNKSCEWVCFEWGKKVYNKKTFLLLDLAAPPCPNLLDFSQINKRLVFTSKCFFLSYLFTPTSLGWAYTIFWTSQRWLAARYCSCGQACSTHGLKESRSLSGRQWEALPRFTSMWFISL